MQSLRQVSQLHATIRVVQVVFPRVGKQRPIAGSIESELVKTMNYTLGDFVIRIKNAVRAHRKDVSAPATKITKGIAKILVKEGFLSGVKESEQDGKKVLVADIVYEKRTPVFTDVKIISKPSLRVYATKIELEKKEKRGLGKIVVSTSAGLMTGKEALKKGLGGELLFQIW